MVTGTVGERQVFYASEHFSPFAAAWVMAMLLKLLQIPNDSYSATAIDNSLIKTINLSLPRSSAAAQNSVQAETQAAPRILPARYNL